MRIISFILVALLGTQLTACGGSSGSSNNGTNSSAAVLSSDNAESIGAGVSEAVLNAILDNSASDDVPVFFSAESVNVGPQVRRALRMAVEPVEEEELTICESGSFSFSGSESNMLMTFNNCVIDEVTLNGNVRYVYANNGDSMKVTYENFTVSFNGEAHSLSGYTVSCTGLNGDNFECAYGTQYTISGQIYRTQNLSVINSGDAYTVEGRIFAGEYGYVDVETTSPLVIGEDDTITSGVLVIRDASGNELTVTFSGSDITICMTTSGSEVCVLLGDDPMI